MAFIPDAQQELCKKGCHTGRYVLFYGGGFAASIYHGVTVLVFNPEVNNC